MSGTWKIYYKGREYATLASATSREDALQQIAEMLLLAQKVSAQKDLKDGVESGLLARPSRAGSDPTEEEANGRIPSTAQV